MSRIYFQQNFERENKFYKTEFHSIIFHGWLLTNKINSLVLWTKLKNLQEKKIQTFKHDKRGFIRASENSCSTLWNLFSTLIKGYIFNFRKLILDLSKIYSRIMWIYSQFPRIYFRHLKICFYVRKFFLVVLLKDTVL